MQDFVAYTVIYAIIALVGLAFYLLDKRKKDRQAFASFVAEKLSLHFLSPIHSKTFTKEDGKKVFLLDEKLARAVVEYVATVDMLCDLFYEDKPRRLVECDYKNRDSNPSYWISEEIISHSIDSLVDSYCGQDVADPFALWVKQLFYMKSLGNGIDIKEITEIHVCKHLDSAFMINGALYNTPDGVFRCKSCTKAQYVFSLSDKPK